MEGLHEADPLSRDGAQLPPAPAMPRIAVPAAGHLRGMADGWAEAFARAAGQFASIGAEVVEADITPLIEAAALLYGGAFVAERYAAVGAHVEGGHPGLDPAVSQIILAGRGPSAADWAADTARLAALGAAGRRALDGCDALLTPTTTWHPTLAEVAADPIGANARMGRFTNFANLLDYASLAFPAGYADGLPFGVMLSAPAFSDRLLADLAARFGNAEREIFVAGAHLSGQPLNSQLVMAGGTLAGPAQTAKAYRLHALGTVPAKPGLVRVDSGGTSVAGEVWRLPAAGFGAFVASVPPPMVIGRVELAGGRTVSGFLTEPYALAGAPDISEFGGWRAYLSR
jgi:allophanate hydrolase